MSDYPPNYIGSTVADPTERPEDDNGDFELKWAKQQEQQAIEWLGRPFFEILEWVIWYQKNGSNRR